MTIAAIFPLELTSSFQFRAEAIRSNNIIILLQMENVKDNAFFIKSNLFHVYITPFSVEKVIFL